MFQTYTQSRRKSKCHRNVKVSLTPDFVQAILSQFSQKTKASTDETDEAVDNAELASLEERQWTPVTKSRNWTKMMTKTMANKLDPSVEASDEAMVWARKQWLRRGSRGQRRLPTRKEHKGESWPFRHHKGFF